MTIMTERGCSRHIQLIIDLSSVYFYCHVMNEGFVSGMNNKAKRLSQFNFPLHLNVKSYFVDFKPDSQKHISHLRKLTKAK